MLRRSEWNPRTAVQANELCSPSDGIGVAFDALRGAASVTKVEPAGSAWPDAA